MAQAQAQAVIAALTDAASAAELGQLTTAMINLIGTDVAAKQALGAAIGSDEAAADSIVSGMSLANLNNLGAALSNDASIQNAIDAGIAANLQPGAQIHAAIAAGAPVGMAPVIAPVGMAPVGMAPGVAGQIDGPIPCGTPAELGDGNTRVVRSGYCFPDIHNNTTCKGTILVNPASPLMPIQITDIFRRDSLFVNFGAGGNNTLSRDLLAISTANNALFIIDPVANDENTFNYRNFFIADPSDKNISDTRRMAKNIVRLRYAVGQSYTRMAPDLSNTAAVTNDLERMEIEDAKRNTMSTFNMNKNWRICPEFFTYRMLPLKTGFRSAYSLNRGNPGTSKKPTCMGLRHDNDELYLYTFVDANGTFVTKDTKINGKSRSYDNTFEAGDLPYQDDFFKFPRGFENTIVCARFPDGILFFSYRGILSPIPPPGTVVDKNKLHMDTIARQGYPDQVEHTAIKTALDTTINALTNTHLAALNAKTITLNGIAVLLNSPVVANVRDAVIGGAGYIGMMRAIRGIIERNKVIRFGGGNNTTRRRHNKSVKRSNKMTRSMSKGRGRGRGRARVASMLKSAKQRFYKTGGGGMGLGLGFGQSAPQPFQCNSPLVSQASSV